MAQANACDLIGSNRVLLDNLVEDARQVMANPEFEGNMEAALVLTVLNKNRQVTGINETSNNVAHFLFELALRAEMNTLPVGYGMNIGQFFRMIDTVDDGNLGEILPDDLRGLLAAAPPLASLVGPFIQERANAFYFDKYGVHATDLELTLIVKVIQDKFQPDP